MNAKFEDIVNEKVLQARIQTNPFEKLSNVVKDVLEEAIIKFAILPGNKINMVAVSEALNISRTPVRDALNAMLNDGLVVTREDKNGYYVFDITDSYMEDFFAARSAIEGAAARICAQRFDRIDMNQLKKYSDTFKQCYSTKDYGVFVKADRAFHALLVNSTENPFLINMFETLKRPLEYYASFSKHYLKTYGYMNQQNFFYTVINQHIAICNMITLGLADSAERAAQQHVDTSYGSFLRYYYHSQSAT